MEMDRSTAIELISRNKSELQKRFGVTQLALFGSTGLPPDNHRSQK
jgi:predicted nucleotidyltransferase